MKNVALSAVLLSFGLASCATVARGTTEEVIIKVTPSDAKVTTSLNHACQTNPCVVKVPRKDSFVVKATKPGYKEQSVHVGTKVSGKGAAGLAGNILLGGVVGVGVDAATGASKDHTPNPVIINLVPEGSTLTPAPTPVPQKKRRGKKSAPTS